MKLVTLLALVTGHRLQTFTFIRLQNILQYPDRIEIKIPDKIKTSSSKTFQPLLVIPFFRANPQLCLASVIDFYEAYTRELRPANTDLLKKPFCPASSQRLSKWVKMTLEISGVNINTFSGYTTRHASTSAAHRSEVSIETIKNTAGWTKKSLYVHKILQPSSM